MPTYLYCCRWCKNSFDVVKSLGEIDSEEACACGYIAERRIARTNFANAGDWQPAYNPALGTVIRSKAHQREVLSRLADQGKKMIEIGNEPVGNLHKMADTTQKERRDARWSESADKIIHEVLR